MNTSALRIAELERANYYATLSTAEATPGLEVIIRDDVIITVSEIFPSRDANHACLLQATADTVDGLITDIVDCYHSRGLPATVALSPACAPHDLEARLRKAGFSRQGTPEAWMTLEHVQNRVTPDLFGGVEVRRITPDRANDFSRVFVEAFDMPPECAPAMAQLLEPSVGLPNVFHYLALIHGEPVGTFSLLHYGTYGVVGSAGVLPKHRRSGAATNLTVQAIREAQRLGIETLIQQTEAGRPLERLLRITGFDTIFTRTYYTLDEHTG